jgi:SulP family sulfate permease
MSIFALALMLGLKKVKALSKPSVLIAVVITTLVSYWVGFEQKATARIDHIATPDARQLVAEYATADQEIKKAMADSTAKGSSLRAAEKAGDVRLAADLRHQIDLLGISARSLEVQNRARLAQINRLHFERSKQDGDAPATLHVVGRTPAGAELDGRIWHIKKVEKGELRLMGGGDVVGTIPAGLPSLKVPALGLDAIMSLLAAALVIALVAFMESISMAKALAAQTKQRLDPNQELIGQGLANVCGAFFQSYPATGSFTGSAINLQAGAKTGFAMVFNGLFVAVTLLFLTDYLYHLPKAVLAVIILLAVTSLVTPEALKHTWKASRADGMVAAVTFLVTLIAAPHLDKGIIVGAGLALVLFLYQTMKPRVAILGRYEDGTLRDTRVHQLPASKVVTVVRFDGRLYFANVSYFEDAVLNAVAENPEAPYVLIVGDGINDIDASGEEVIHHLVERLNDSGTVVLFCGLKKQVIDVMRATGLWEIIGAGRFHSTTDQALESIFARPEYAGEDDPLKPALRPAAS